MTHAERILGAGQELVLEQMLEGLGVHALALVADPHSQHAAVLALGGEIHVQAYFAAFAELDRVAEQVGQHLQQTVPVAAHPFGQHAIHHRRQLQILGLGHGAEGFQGLFQGTAQVEIIRAQGNAAGENPGVVQHVVDQADHQLAALPRHLQIFLLLIAEPGVFQQRHHAHHRIHRRTQFVGQPVNQAELDVGVGGQVPAPLSRAAPLAGDRVPEQLVLATVKTEQIEGVGGHQQAQQPLLQPGGQEQRGDQRQEHQQDIHLPHPQAGHPGAAQRGGHTDVIENHDEDVEAGADPPHQPGGQHPPDQGVQNQAEREQPAPARRPGAVQGVKARHQPQPVGGHHHHGAAGDQRLQLESPVDTAPGGHQRINHKGRQHPHQRVLGGPVVDSFQNLAIFSVNHPSTILGRRRR